MTFGVTCLEINKRPSPESLASITCDARDSQVTVMCFGLQGTCDLAGKWLVLIKNTVISSQQKANLGKDGVRRKKGKS